MWGLVKVILLFWFIRWAWRNLIRPLFVSEHAHPWGGSSYEQSPRKLFLSCLMPLLAKVAKSDGVISEDEIRRVEQIFANLNLSAEDQHYAQAVFNQSKTTILDFDDAAYHFAMTFHDQELRTITLQYLIHVACADNTLTANEQRMIYSAAHFFQIPAQLIHYLFAQMGFSSERYSSYRGATSSHSEDTRKADLLLLGLTPSATAEEIKQAYRRKVKELHPDHLQAQGLPESMMKQATERMAAINAAYDRLTHRSHA